MVLCIKIALIQKRQKLDKICMIYGAVRVSTQDQNVNSSKKALAAIALIKTNGR